MANNNRLKEIRKNSGLTLIQLSSEIGIPQANLNRYENKTAEPKIETWEKLADFFKVPTPYLMGISGDPHGWEVWEKNTKLSKNEIKAEIARLIQTDHLTGNEPYYDQQNKAVSVLMDESETDRGAINFASGQLFSILSELRTKYEDPQKVAKLPDNPLERAELKLKPSATFYDDMDADVYQQIHDILTDARNKINAIPTKE